MFLPDATAGSRGDRRAAHPQPRVSQPVPGRRAAAAHDGERRHGEPGRATARRRTTSSPRRQRARAKRDRELRQAGRRAGGMRRQARGYMQGFETPASAATLWRALTDPAMLSRLARDRGHDRAASRRPLRTVSRLFGRREAQIERFDTGSRVQLLYEPNADWPPLSDSALMEDFIIDERKGQRMVRVMGSGIPADEECAKHAGAPAHGLGAGIRAAAAAAQGRHDRARRRRDAAAALVLRRRGARALGRHRDRRLRQCPDPGRHRRDRGRPHPRRRRRAARSRSRTARRSSRPRA